MIARDVALGLLRHLLTLAGGAIASRGYLDAQNLDLAIGAAVTLVGVVWSVLDKRRATATTAVVVAPEAVGGPIAAAAVEGRSAAAAGELAADAARAAAGAVAKNLGLKG